MAQPSLLDAKDTAGSPKKTSPAQSRKRTLTLVDGNTVDLNQKLNPATPEVVEAMRLRILQLEDELAAKPPPAKRARKSAAASKEDDDFVPEATATEKPVASPSTSKADGKKTAAAEKALEKKHRMRVKKIFDQLKKNCKSADCKFQRRGPKTLKVDEVLEPEEFDAIFKGKGTLIQPTPQNKPTSTVTIIKYEGEQDIKAFFGDELKPLKGDRWNVGGGPFFTKSQKLGPCDVEIVRFEAQYSKNTSKATLKFEVDEVGAEGYDSDNDMPFYGRRGGFFF